MLLEVETNENEENTSLMNPYEREEMNEDYLLENEIHIDKKNQVGFDNQELVPYQKERDTEIFVGPEKVYICPICSLEFNTRREKLAHLTGHEKINLKKFNYKCRFCEFECNDREKVAYHMKGDHFNNNKNAFFKDLLAIVVDQRNLTSNLIKSHEIFNTNDDLMNITSTIHSTIVEEINNINNEINNKSINVENNIDHMKLLNLADAYECKICKINFTKKTSFNKHWAAMHLSTEEKELRKQKRKNRCQYLCPECGKSLPTAFTLDYHIRMHKNDRRFKCNLCPKSYISKSHLEAHTNSHRDKDSNKVYKCKSCDKKFRTPHELKIHTRFHGNDKPFKCLICNKTFYIVSHLNEHKKTHTGEKNFICSFSNCVASYRYKRSLRRHLKKHILDDNKINNIISVNGKKLL